jgi:hypothetical protein
MVTPRGYAGHYDLSRLGPAGPPGPQGRGALPTYAGTPQGRRPDGGQAHG